MLESHVGNKESFLLSFIKIKEEVEMRVGITYEMPEWLQCLMGEIDTSIVMSLRKEDAEMIEVE